MSCQNFYSLFLLLSLIQKNHHCSSYISSLLIYEEVVYLLAFQKVCRYEWEIIIHSETEFQAAFLVPCSKCGVELSTEVAVIE